MSETTEANENVQVRISDDYELGEPPHFYSPYPERLTQIKEGDTRGARNVTELINNHWPMSINELVEKGQEKYDDGYSGSFIRIVLRSHYLPTEEVEIKSQEEEEEDRELVGKNHRNNDEEEEDEEEEEVVETKEEEPTHEDSQKERAFRAGIRMALETGLSMEEATNLFKRGFDQGEKLEDEMMSDVLDTIKR